MGRGKGKRKKQSVAAADHEIKSDEDEKFPAKKRGRPQKPLTNSLEEDEVEKADPDEDGNEVKSFTSNKSLKTRAATENSTRTKWPSQDKKNLHFLKEENSTDTKSNSADFIKPVGYRQNGSRRKSKPRRAAEAGIDSR